MTQFLGSGRLGGGFAPNIANAVAGLDSLFGGGGPPDCEAACDANADGNFNIDDPIFMLCGLFLVDFVRSLLVAPSRVVYLFGERPGRSLPYGSLELIGAVPILFYLRFFRVFRLIRAGWTFSDLKPRSRRPPPRAPHARSAGGEPC